MDIKLVWHGQRIAKMSNMINGQVHKWTDKQDGHFRNKRVDLTARWMTCRIMDL